MPMSVDWDDAEHSIILITITYPVTWEVFDAGVDEAVRLAKTVPHRVDIISNPGPTPMPDGSPLPHLQRAFGNFPPNVVLMVALITNTFARITTSVAGQVYLGPRFKVVDSLEAAYAIVYADRADAEPS